MALGAQEPVYFKEAPLPWWRPKGELLVEAERLPPLDEDENGGTSVDRIRSLLQLDWSPVRGSWTGELSVRAAIGSDGNRLNLLRYDQRPSNGVWLHRASVSYRAADEGRFGTLTLGLQGNPLLSQESLWDHDLGVLGVGGRMALRSEGRGLLEAGLRGVAGRVRTFPEGGAELAALQGVVRMETGPVQWTLHAGRWVLHWDAGEHRFQALDPGPQAARVSTRFDTAGGAVAGAAGWPWELKAFVQRNVETRGTGGEGQLWLGPMERRYRPRFGFILQRYAATGTAPLINGDEWWFTRAAKGPRVVMTLPLPRGLRITLHHLEHRLDGERRPVRRTGLVLSWRF
ncbi:MAG: hypothetical protein IPL96_12460 [Holophagaceae bacterium]|nr:hypothetical protein [Holophagaceae bacterium]